MVVEPPIEMTPAPETSAPEPEPEAPAPAEEPAVEETFDEAPSAEKPEPAPLSSPAAPPAAATPPAASTVLPPTPPPQDTAELDSLRSAVDAQKQTISVLTTEKTQQAAQLDQLDGRLDAVQADLAKRTEELTDSRSTAGRLETRVTSLEGERKDLYAQVEKLTGRTKELQAAEGFRDEVARLKKSEAALEKRIAEADARRKADDEKEGGQVKELEASLKRTRERGDDLEREVGRLKKVRQVKPD